MEYGEKFALYMLNPGLTFFRFHLSDTVRRAKWIAALRREHWVPVKSTGRCNEHNYD